MPLLILYKQSICTDFLKFYRCLRAVLCINFEKTWDCGAECQSKLYSRAGIQEETETAP